MFLVNARRKWSETLLHHIVIAFTIFTSAAEKTLRAVSNHNTDTSTQACTESKSEISHAVYEVLDEVTEQGIDDERQDPGKY